MVEMGRKEKRPLLDSVLLNISCDLHDVVWCNEQQRFSLYLFNLPLERRKGSFIC